jgi:threo-3-hydroxy-L-aspartate ammonia-lyase
VLTVEDVRAAAARLEGVARRTPVMTSRTLDEAVGARVCLKCESFQRGGAFKFRGAYNFLSSLAPAERERGVCAVSSGNHAQAVAIAARELGLDAAILMPEDAPPVKLEATAGYGAEVVTYDRYTTPPVVAGARFAEERSMTFVPAYDDPRIAAGAGTGALELVEDCGSPDVVVVPIGGGGVMSGWATVVKALNPQVRVIGVENAANASTRLSLEAGRRVTVELRPHLADGQMLTTPGEFTFEVMRRLVDEVVLVTDDEILAAMAFLFDRLKLVTEPSGATATAALLAGHVRPAGTVAALISGGNVGLRRFAERMSTGKEKAPPERGLD